MVESTMLSPDEEKALEIGFNAALKPVNEALSNILGPSSHTIGRLLNAMLCTQMRNVVKVYGRAAEILSRAGIPIAPVPLKLLKPILDGASVEEDEMMQELWAALLANAGGGMEAGRVQPVFVDILRQLTPQDARVLQSLYDFSRTKQSRIQLLGSERQLVKRFASEYPKEYFINSCQNLLHLTIISVGHESGEEELDELEGGGTLVGEIQMLAITPFGVRFIEACEPPMKSS
jgi:hypothetical protein